MTDRAYCRISLDTERSGSITKQRSQIETRSREPEWYEDRSVSGSKIPFAERPAGGRLLRDLEKGDRVLVTKIDRAARNVRDLLDLVERVEEVGASISFVEQGIDTAGPMGRFLLTLLGAIAELEAGIIAERRRESLVVFKREGRHAVGAAPYGLRSVTREDGRGLVLRPDPVQAPLLRDAVERLLEGVTQSLLSKDLGLGEAGFSRLLRNERLAGIYDHDEDGTPRIDPDMAVFSLAEWRALQARIDRPAKAWTRAEGYGEALACATCGHRLYLSKANPPRKDTYKCGGRRFGQHRADAGPIASVTREKADPQVERDFLTRFGGLPVTEVVTIDSSAERDEAVALARMRVERVRAAQDAAETDEEEDRLLEDYRKAKRALRDAEALPVERVTKEIPTGKTFAEVWEAADQRERVRLLLEVGPWLVRPGWLPIEEKVSLQPEPDYLAGQLD